ncbi:MAG: beta-lactamase family protein [Psychroserpens sp.]|nr:beta-lactamase family protein [Psychroserpens sp.]
MKYLFVLLFVFQVSLTAAQQAQLKQVDSIINSKISEVDPGLMVGIVKGGQIIYEKYRGLANLQHQVKISEKTRSNIASTAKQFTALMILQMAMDQKLSLEDDIRTYLPDLYPKVKGTIRIRHLLNHTSGIRDYVELMGLQNKIWWKQVGLDNGDILELIAKQEDLGFTPGSEYSYSNAGYVLLAEIIEKVSNQKFTNYSKSFFKTLGMNETSFVEKYMGVIPNRAEPYADWGSGDWLQTPTVTKTAGEGFLFTTLKDQLIYEMAIQNAEKDKNDLLLKSQETIPNSEITTYGFGLKLQDWLGRKAVHHDGVTYSYHSQTIRFPEEKLTIFIMSNNGNIRSDLIANEIAKVFLPKIDNSVANNTNRNSDSITKSKAEPASFSDLQSFIGKYVNKELDLNFELMLNDANELSFLLSSEKNADIVEVINRNTLLVSGLVLKIQRDQFNRVTEILLTYDRAKNIRFKKTTNLKFQPKIQTENGSINVTTIGSRSGESSNILLTKNLENGNEIWSKQFGGNSYDKANSIMATENGYLIIGSTSSYGKGNYDILIIETDKQGNKLWQNTFGGFYNDYGYTAEITDNGYLIKGTTQTCENNTDINRTCNTNVWFVEVDKKGNEISNTVLEEWH